MKKKPDLWIYSYPNLKKLLIELKIAIFIIAAGVSNVLATPINSEVVKAAADVNNVSVEYVLEKSENYLLNGSQQRLITGTVTDASTGETLPGVNVRIEGTIEGTVTDINGKFSMTAPAQNSVLVFSFVGFVTQSITYTGQQVIDVKIASDLQILEEVVVVGYGTQVKKDITGSVSVVKTDDLLSTPSASFTGQLQGRATGIQVGSSGAPGSGSTIRIRGVGSVNDNAPLFVIDGVSTRDQDMTNINPNDIESIQILKDASSASIYGAQAANGVIIITTKKGTQSGQPKLTYDSYFGYQKLGDGYDLLNSEEWMETEYQMQVNAYAMRNLTTAPSHAQFGTGTFALPDFLIPTGANEGAPNTTLADYNVATNRIARTNKIGTYWYDEITQTAPIQNHQLSMVGGNDKGTYALSLNSFNQKGTVKFSYFDRYSFRANSQFNVRPYIRVGENLTISYSKYNNNNSGATSGGPIGRAMLTVPYIPVYDIAGNFAGNSASASGATSNVYGEIVSSQYNKNNNMRLLGNIYAEIDFLKDFNFRTSYGIDYSNLFTVNMARNQPYTQGSSPTSFTESARFNTRWVFSNTLTYKHTFASIHSINLLLGTEAITDGIGRTLSGSRQQYLFEDDQNTWILDNGSSATATNSSSFNGEVTFFSLFGRLDYSLLDKYLVTGILRRDGGSRFSESNRFGYFPAVSLGWRLSEEAFLKGIPWISNLKLRVGYGTTGNSEIPNKYNWANRYTTDFNTAYYDFANTQTGTSGYRLSAYGNLDTKWETTRMVNTGVDATFFDQKLEITVDYFIKNTTDMLVPAAYSALAGTPSAPYVNFGDMKNTGTEIMITHRNTINKDWSYEVSGNLSTYENTVVKISNNDNATLYGSQNIGNVNITKKGLPIGMFYGWKTLGFYDSEAEVLEYTTEAGVTVLPYGVASLASLNPKAWVGKWKFQDTDGNGKIDGNDFTIIGNPHPDFTASLNLSVNYKSFDLGMYWFSTVGNEIFRLVKEYTDFGFLVGARSKDLLYDSWRPDHLDASLPILDSQDPVSSKGPHSGYIENGSFLKLKNLTLGYTLPARALSRLNLSNFRLYIQGSNLLTVTKYKGLDPEIMNSSTSGSGDLSKGVDGGYWPMAKQYIIGLTLSF